jgi:hypothetical protein
MSYRDFKFPKVYQDLGLGFREDQLFHNVHPVKLDSWIMEHLEAGRVLSSGLGNEKARSEFVIAPFLLQLLRISDKQFGLFSGYELDADATRGLTGICDFLLAREPLFYVLKAPVLAVIEAKNDNVNNGFAQCIASMKAIEVFNKNNGNEVSPIYGASTTGVAWKFFRLENDVITLDRDDYEFADLDKVAAILLQIVGWKPKTPQG